MKSNTQHPTPNTQHPTPNTQHPTPNTQHPTPNTQHPTPNTQSTLQPRTIFCRDNLEILRGINSESIDLIYLDPPFNKGKKFHAPVGSEASGAEFDDIWKEESVKEESLYLIEDQYPKIYAFLQGIEQVGSRSAKYYLIYMAERLIEMQRILKSTGSLYLHCDPTASHYLKILLDAIFGHLNFRNEIIWGYGLGGSSKRQFSKKHDVIFFYSKTDAYVFEKPSTPATSQMMAGSMKGMPDTWVGELTGIPSLNNMAKERVGYPTQKPLALLERIISASSNEGDLVLDPFCGCATTCVAAERLARDWIGIDVSPKAYDLVKMRIEQDEKQGVLASQGYLNRKKDKDPIYRTDIPERTDISGYKTKPTKADKDHLYGKQGGNCGGCKKHFEKINLEIDHIVPQSQGGGHEIENLQLLCGYCNRTKGDRGMPYLVSQLKAKGLV